MKIVRLLTKKTGRKLREQVKRIQQATKAREVHVYQSGSQFDREQWIYRQ